MKYSLYLQYMYSNIVLFFMFNVKFYYWISCDFIVKCDFYLLIEELVNLNIEDFYVYVLNFIAKVLLLSVTGI